MPTYDYKCQACGHEYERFQPITAEPIKKCPKCGKNQAKRLIGAGAGLIFKGSGFYVTDYRDKAYTERAKSDTSGGSDTKAATATESTTAKTADSSSAGKTDSSTEPKAAAGSDGKAASSNAKSKAKPASKSGRSRES